MATGRDATLIASPLVGLPYLIIARTEIRTVQDLKGKTMGVCTIAGLSYQLLKAFVKKFSLEDMQIRFLGGSQSSREAFRGSQGKKFLIRIIHDQRGKPTIQCRPKGEPGEVKARERTASTTSLALPGKGNNSLPFASPPAVCSWPQGTGPSPWTRRAHPEAIGRV
jgi:hypothetical protein